jgi:hypothetical protein
MFQERVEWGKGHRRFFECSRRDQIRSKPLLANVPGPYQGHRSLSNVPEEIKEGQSHRPRIFHKGPRRVKAIEGHRMFQKISKGGQGHRPKMF